MDQKIEKFHFYNMRKKETPQSSTIKNNRMYYHIFVYMRDMKVISFEAFVRYSHSAIHV